MERSREAVRKYLENFPDDLEAWRHLAAVCRRLNDVVGEVHALVEFSEQTDTPFVDISNAANRFNARLSTQEKNLDRDDRQLLAGRLADVMHNRLDEAAQNSYSRLAWLLIHAGDTKSARKVVVDCLAADPNDEHCHNLARRLAD